MNVLFEAALKTFFKRSKKISNLTNPAATMDDERDATRDIVERKESSLPPPDNNCTKGDRLVSPLPFLLDRFTQLFLF
jgi:hypothetical protein